MVEQKWGGHESVPSTRVTASGLVRGGECSLWWILLDADGEVGGMTLDLRNNLDGSGTPKMTLVADQDESTIFDVPGYIPWSTGLHATLSGGVAYLGVGSRYNPGEQRVGGPLPIGVVRRTTTGLAINGPADIHFAIYNALSGAGPTGRVFLRNNTTDSAALEIIIRNGPIASKFWRPDGAYIYYDVGVFANLTAAGQTVIGYRNPGGAVTGD